MAGKSSFNFHSFILSFKLSGSVKYDAMNPNSTEFKAAIENKNNDKVNTKKDTVVNLLFVLSSIKQTIQEVLKDNNCNINIIVDKLDDFQIKDKYIIQKNILHALMCVEDSYVDYRNISLYIFLRTDLYERIEIPGKDKIDLRSVKLSWSNDDIKEFISKRICKNYFDIFKLKYIEILINEDELYNIDEDKKDYVEDNDTQQKETLYQKIKKRIPKKLKDEIKKIFPRISINHQHKIGRKNTLTNEVNKEIICSIIPDVVKHYNKNLKVTDISLYSFFNSHLSLANGINTPRFAILFLEKIFHRAEKYYNENKDLPINNMAGKFDLFTPEMISEGYSDFIETVFNLFIRITEEETTWKTWLESFYTMKGNKFSFSYADLSKMLKIKSREKMEFQYFLSFLTHLNILSCNSRTTKFESRNFKLPILFRCNITMRENKENDV
ncbi:MAG: hypothetical protein KAT05_05810 [Spirochaetes bacterium]|nr:hypothetical protein [Spirochaetota bacterium]